MEAFEQLVAVALQAQSFGVPSAHVYDCGTRAGYRGAGESRAPCWQSSIGRQLPGNDPHEAAGKGWSAQVGKATGAPGGACVPRVAGATTALRCASGGLRRRHRTATRRARRVTSEKWDQ
jgi:hypothetical protein